MRVISGSRENRWETMAIFLVRNRAGTDSKESSEYRNKWMDWRNRFNKTIMEWLECKLHEGRDYFSYHSPQCLTRSLPGKW